MIHVVEAMIHVVDVRHVGQAVNLVVGSLTDVVSVIVISAMVLYQWFVQETHLVVEVVHPTMIVKKIPDVDVGNPVQ